MTHNWRVWILWSDFSWEEIELVPPKEFNPYMDRGDNSWDDKENFLNKWIRESYLAKEDIPFVIDVLYRGEVTEFGN